MIIHYQLLDGFKLHKIIYRAPYHLEWENHPFSLLTPKILSILDQECTYLGKGRQAYVFETKDQNYVIKCLRYHKYQKPLWVSLFSYLSILTPRVENFLFHSNERFDRAIKSYLLAANQLRDKTNLLYLHLNQTAFFDKKLFFRAKSGQELPIDLDKTAFIIQEKGTPLDEVMISVRNDKKEVHRLISQLLENVFQRTRRGIMNRDPMIVRNSGLKNNELFEMDIGSFYHVKNVSGEEIQAELDRSNELFRAFILQNIPEYLSFFESEIKRLKESPDKIEAISSL